MLASFSRWLATRDGLRRDVRTAAVALVVASVVMATPSVAAKIQDADSVDGLSAIKATTSTSARKGKLVATDSHGRLPDNIIAKSRDADRLDGLDSASYATKSARRGEVRTGDFGAWGGGSGSYLGDTVLLGARLPVRIPENRTTVLAPGASPTAECPGPGRVNPQGWLCIYTAQRGSIGTMYVYNPTDAGYGTSRTGFGLYASCSDTGCWAYGSWALRVGSSADLPDRPAPSRRTVP
ncbi:hypothetical protein [Nocardioides plantarum]|uniref:Secreted protein n=1 Tax=Nocardioides plantarum TaxID=29299 RepID=A0ABV5KHI3_9ACTN|nr:hypothetical protein [Nocardioides plantarum]